MLPQLVAISARADSHTDSIASLSLSPSRFAFVCMEGESVAALRAAGQSKLRASGHGARPRSISLSLFARSFVPFVRSFALTRSLPRSLPQTPDSEVRAFSFIRRRDAKSLEAIGNLREEPRLSGTTRGDVCIGCTLATRRRINGLSRPSCVS